MDSKLRRWQLGGFLFTAAAGTLLHFLYDWIESPWVAAFSGVNESTWEHMKLLFWPAFIYAIAEYYLIKDHENFWWLWRRWQCLATGTAVSGG